MVRSSADLACRVSDEDLTVIRDSVGAQNIAIRHQPMRSAEIASPRQTACDLRQLRSANAKHKTR